MTGLSRVGLGAAIQRARAKAGLSQGQLGDLTGLGQPLISRIEAGSRKVDLVELVTIAGALAVRLDDILEAAQAPQSDEIAGATELIALRVAGARDAQAVRQSLAWVDDFVEKLRRLEQLDAQATEDGSA